MEISAMTPSKTLEKMVANPKYSHFWNSGAVLLNRRLQNEDRRETDYFQKAV